MDSVVLIREVLWNIDEYILVDIDELSITRSGAGLGNGN